MWAHLFIYLYPDWVYPIHLFTYIPYLPIYIIPYLPIYIIPYLLIYIYTLFTYIPYLRIYPVWVPNSACDGCIHWVLYIWVPTSDVNDAELLMPSRDFWFLIWGRDFHFREKNEPEPSRDSIQTSPSRIETFTK